MAKADRVVKALHGEHHFDATDTIRDVVIGMSDGLTVPFALAAGISGAIAASHIVVTAGVAELAAGAISMGLGGYLAAQTDAEHYESEVKREEREVDEMPDAERFEVASIFRSYGLQQAEADKVTAELVKDRKRWIDFMMRFELGLEKPNRSRAPVSALTIGGSYVVGGLIPLVPYMLVPDSTHGLYISCVITAIALGIFGGVKGRATGVSWVRSAFQTLIIGGAAAAVAFAIARLVAGTP
ncbi:MAG TPA: VIT1/CCC1 transporter family protein [Candidatus Eremiobacteraceae bacterium]|nr:VIT1/CCC1 transporter family protein [Candidatus Eremiobacteraceae bacterium]